MTGVLSWIILVAALIAMAMALLRLTLGPLQADRIIALDVVFSANIALMSALSLVSGRHLYLDVAIGVALVSFVATLVWSRLISPHHELHVVERTETEEEG